MESERVFRLRGEKTPFKQNSIRGKLMKNYKANKLLRTGLISVLSLGILSSNVNAYTLKKPTEETLSNIALHKPYQVFQEMYDKQLMSYETRTDGDNGNQYELTDGKIAESKVDGNYFLNPNWVGYSRQVARSIVIDLEESKFIRSITSGFLQERAAAVDMPRYVNYYLSDNGEDWYIADQFQPQNSKTHEAIREEVISDSINVSARYVKIEFEVGMFSFLDEITINGRDVDAKDKKVKTLKKVKPKKDAPLPDKKDTNGVKDMYLAFLYPDHTGNGPLGTWRKEDFKHVVSHVDESGNQTDWLFDTVLFQNGGDPFKDYKDKALWSQSINKLFTQDVNLDALDQSTGETKVELNDKKHKTKVVVAIPYPSLQSTDWGTIDGKKLNFSINQPGGEEASFADRKAAVQWYIDEVEKQFKEKDYKNIELAGFYWIHEEIGFGTIYEEALLKHTSKIIHDKDYRFFWIPFFQANGSTIWKELGFDAVMMQPNYYFQSYFGPNVDKGGEVDLSRLNSTIQTAKRFGMGVEVEGDYHMLWDGWGTDYDGQLYHSDYAMRKYYAYLNEIHRAKLDETIVGYYLGARTVIKQIVDDPVVRKTYDQTYRFIKDIYDMQELSNESYPPPSGDTWSNPTLLEAKEGDVYTTSKALAKDQWFKFPIKAGEDWMVTLTPLEGSSFGMESRLWAVSQTPHSGFSYGKESEVQSLIVSNPISEDNYGMIRVLAKNGVSGKYKISLSKPIEDGKTMKNSIELDNGGSLTGVASQENQEIWYRVSGKKEYHLVLNPDTTEDADIELYYDMNSGVPQAASRKSGKEPELINYVNPYAPSFVYYIKVKAKTPGTFTITNQ